VVVQCSAGSCTKLVHPVCARKEENCQWTTCKSDMDPDEYIYCSEHSVPKSKPVVVRSTESKALHRHAKVCDVCMQARKGNRFFECADCGVQVHKTCYKAGKTEEGKEGKEWRCEACCSGVVNEECVLCCTTDSTLSMLPVWAPNACDKAKPQWAHTFCAIWAPETEMRLAATEEESQNIPAEEAPGRKEKALCRSDEVAAEAKGTADGLAEADRSVEEAEEEDRGIAEEGPDTTMDPAETKRARNKVAATKSRQKKKREKKSSPERRAVEDEEGTAEAKGRPSTPKCDAEPEKDTPSPTGAKASSGRKAGSTPQVASSPVLSQGKQGSEEQGQAEGTGKQPPKEGKAQDPAVENIGTDGDKAKGTREVSSEIRPGAEEAKAEPNKSIDIVGDKAKAQNRLLKQLQDTNESGPRDVCGLATSPLGTTFKLPKCTTRRRVSAGSEDGTNQDDAGNKIDEQGKADEDDTTKSDETVGRKRKVGPSVGKGRAKNGKGVCILEDGKQDSGVSSDGAYRKRKVEEDTKPKVTKPFAKIRPTSPNGLHKPWEEARVDIEFSPDPKLGGGVPKMKRSCNSKARPQQLPMDGDWGSSVHVQVEDLHELRAKIQAAKN